MAESTSLVPAERIERAILSLRGHRVMLDFDLAEVFGVSTRRLNEQVRRNEGRFPEDFMFRLTGEELDILRSQFATAKLAKRRSPVMAFTEHGAVMLASVLNSPVAVQASVQVVRAFVRLRRLLQTHEALARKVAELESKYDSQFLVVFEAIKKLMAPQAKTRLKIGFRH
jgi:hypothetical protein